MRVITEACAHVGAELDERGRSPLEMAEGELVVSPSRLADRSEIARLLRARVSEEWVAVELTASSSNTCDTPTSTR